MKSRNRRQIFKIKKKIKLLQLQASKLAWEGEFGRLKCIQEYQYKYREQLVKLKYVPREFMKTKIL